jgi:hypothetical protein
METRSGATAQAAAGLTYRIFPARQVPKCD